MNIYTLDEVQDEIMGKIGTPRRDLFENHFKIELLGSAIRNARLERNMTEEELGRLSRVSKNKILRIESDPNTVTINTLMKVLTVLKAKIKLQVELANMNVELE